MTPAELRALLAKATPGPMRVTKDYDYGTVRIWGARDLVSNDVCIAEDAALIVAAVNALPALLDVAEAAQRLVERSASIDETHPAYGFLVMAIPLAKALAKLGSK